MKSDPNAELTIWIAGDDASKKFENEGWIIRLGASHFVGTGGPIYHQSRLTSSGLENLYKFWDWIHPKSREDLTAAGYNPK